MSQAPSIPNLLTRRGGPRSRGGGRSSQSSQAGDDSIGRLSRLAPSARSAEQATIHDQVIQQTDSDALLSRISAINTGYLKDKFSSQFTTEPTPRRLPIINRGTYVRTSCIDLLVDQFIKETPGQKQIVSLGAGTDTRYFRLREQNKDYNLYYHEVDFPKVSAKKLAAIRSSRILSASPSPFCILNDVNLRVDPTVRAWGFIKEEKYKQGYAFHPVDLRDIKATGDNWTHPQSFDKIDTDVPTLIISECCLCYLPVEIADGILKFFAQKMKEPAFIIYEPTASNDEFGRMMSKNLALRGIHMPTVDYYRRLEDQEARLKEIGCLSFSAAADIDWLWENWIAPTEQQRVNALEGLDEVEEWQLLARHYCIAYGYRERPIAEGGDLKFRGAWGALRKMTNNRGVGFAHFPDEEDELQNAAGIPAATESLQGTPK